MKFSDALRQVGLLPARVEERAQEPTPLAWGDYPQQFVFGGNRYVVSSLGSKSGEQIAERNAPVAALMAFRARTLSEVRFQFQRIDSKSSRPGKLFGSTELAILEDPWPGGSTGDLLSTVSDDSDKYGNSYWIRERSEFWNRDVMVRLDPCKVKIFAEAVTEPVSGQVVSRSIVGYSFQDKPGSDIVLFPADRVGHHRAPLSDQEWPEFKGRSWIGTVIEDACADDQLTGYKRSFLANAVIPGLVMPTPDDITPEDFAQFVETMESQHAGVMQSFKTLYLAGGGDPKTIGVDFSALSLHEVQGAGETRLAGAAGVPPTLVPFSEGMKGSSLNTGNFEASRRLYADMTCYPWWREVCSAFSTLVQPPASQFAEGGTSRLWYDERDVAFLRENAESAASIRQADAITMKTLVDAGFSKPSIVAAIEADDMTLLEDTGLVSVQLQAPGQPIAATTKPRALPAA